MLFLTLLLASILLVNSNPVPTPNLEDGGLFEGDIAGIEEWLNPGRPFQLVTTSRGKWPGGVVPYVYDAASGYTAAQKTTIEQGFAMIENLTKVGNRQIIFFRPRGTEATYLRIFSDSGCYSYVGRQNAAGAQNLSLQIRSASGGTCITAGIAAHEAIHALGWFHAQSRPDRDSFVRINTANIQAGAEGNFNKYTTSSVTVSGLPYDYCSVMHYSATSFSVNGQPTITALQTVSGCTMGQRTTLSTGDIAKIQAQYA